MAENVMAQSQGNEDRGVFVSADGIETFWVSRISTSYQNSNRWNVVRLSVGAGIPLSVGKEFLMVLRGESVEKAAGIKGRVAEFSQKGCTDRGM
jgi:hypothetical protein